MNFFPQVESVSPVTSTDVWILPVLILTHKPLFIFSLADSFEEESGRVALVPDTQPGSAHHNTFLSLE